jgi:hypothetical protein
MDLNAFVDRNRLDLNAFVVTCNKLLATSLVCSGVDFE